jgi:hypothetical protein
MRVASLGNLADAPSFCDEMELLNHARERNLETIRLALKREQSGIVLLGRTAEGAHTCRRRVLDELSEQVTGVPQSDLVVTVGVASFPHDGGDLSRLLRVAKQRAEASLNSAVHQLSLRDLSIPGLVDALLSRPARESTLPTRGVEYPHYIELPAMDRVGLALAAVSEAWRAGQARVVASVHAGISVGGAVRAEHARDGEGLRFDAVDVSALEGCANLDVLCIVAEHSSYVLLGRTEGNVVRAVHAADPLLVDLVLSKLSEATDLRLND